MSELKKHLESAKREYLSMKYPGDLAKNVLRPPRSVIVRLMPLAALAAAAVIAIVFYFSNVTENPKQLVSAISTTQSSVAIEPTTQAVASETLLDSFDDLSDMSVVPPSYSFDISLPSFSLTADQPNNSTSTTQEST